VPAVGRFRHHLRVAREEALLACDLYNQRRRERNLEAFIVHMAIAWLNLFHAICLKHDVDHIYRRGRRIERVDGEPKTWDLEKCVRHFIPDESDPVRANIEFFIRFRNKIEHRFNEKQMRNLEALVAAKSQAYLLNFEKLLVAEFGERSSLGDDLRFPLFLSSLTDDAVEAAKQIYERVPRRVRSFIDQYDSSQGDDVRHSDSYEFRIYLMPKTSSKAKADLAIEFVDLSKLSEEQRDAIENARVIIRDRHVETANMDRFKAGEVVERLKAVYPGFQMHHHVLAWKKHGIRPASNAADPARTDARYAVYDRAHRDYLFTEAWFSKLAEELRTEPEATIESWRNAGQAQSA
jgi:hypothetical protein